MGERLPTTLEPVHLLIEQLMDDHRPFTALRRLVFALNELLVRLQYALRYSVSGGAAFSPRRRPDRSIERHVLPYDFRFAVIADREGRRRRNIMAPRGLREP